MEFGARFVIHTLLVLVGLGLFLRTMYGRGMALMSVRWTNLFDKIPERIQALLVLGFGQKKFLIDERERSAGWMHFFIFWGFTILALQILTMFGRGYSSRFHIPLIGGGPYLLVRDLMEITVIVCIAVALTRWLVTHPPRLFGYAPAENRLRSHSHWEAYVILSFIGTIMITGLIYDGSRVMIHSADPEVAAEAAWEPLSSLVGRLLFAATGPGFTELTGNAAWWIHNLVVLVFLNLLPPSKHFHIITSLPNVYFEKLEPKGALSKQDLENATHFGTSHIDQFTWKQVLDMYSCTECGRCSSQVSATRHLSARPGQLLLTFATTLRSRNEMIEARPWKPNATAPSRPPCENSSARCRRQVLCVQRVPGVQDPSGAS